MFRSLLRPSSGRSKRILIKYNDCPNCISKTTWCYSEYLKRYQWSLNFGLIWFYRRIKCTLLLKTNQIWCVCFYFLVAHSWYTSGRVNKYVCQWGDGIIHFMTMGSAWDTHCNGEWFYLRRFGNCYILSVYLQCTLMVVAQATNTCGWVSMCDKAYFISVHLLVCHVIVDIVPYWKKRKVCFIGGKSLVD